MNNKFLKITFYKHIVFNLVVLKREIGLKKSKFAKMSDFPYRFKKKKKKWLHL